MLPRLLLLVLRVVFAPLWLLRHVLGRPRGRWVVLRLGSHVAEVAAEPPFWMRWVGASVPRRTRLSDVCELVDALAVDPHRVGLLLVVDPMDAGFATAEAIRDALGPLRAAGKQTVAYLPRGGGAKELLVALACDRVVVAPPVSLALPGVAAGGLYLGALLERLGLRLERFTRSEYKTAYETLERSRMSDGQREQLGAIVAGLGAALDGALESRGLARPELEARGLCDASFLVERGVAQAQLYEDELPAFLGLTAKEKLVPAGAYLAHARRRWLPRIRLRPYVGVIPVRGVIGEGDGPGGIATLVGTIRTAHADPRVRAVVLHVDSPGGSALGSDLLHREVERLASAKPVVASFGNVAASGGYYVAAPARSIHARSSTVTGSIGVVAARPSAEGLLARLGVVREEVGEAPHSTMFDPARPLAPASREALERSIELSYRRFVEVVATGRRRTPEEVEPLARGRVYLGTQAHALGLVDGLGGYPEAVAEARRLAEERGARDLAVELVRFRGGQVPEPPPLQEVAVAWLAAMVRAPVVACLAPETLPFADPVDLGLPTATRLGLSSPHGVMRRMRMLLGSFLMVFAVACGGAQMARVDSRPMPEGGTYHGVWYSPQYGEMHLCQSQNQVVGEYTKNERRGTVRGTLEGDLLHFEWREEREFIPGRPVVTRGHGYFRISKNDNEDWVIEGQWGHDADEVGGGPWTAVLQPRTSPDNCYNSIRRTAPSAQGSDEIRFADEPASSTP